MSQQGRTLPKNALERALLGQAFAEYDPALHKGDVYVYTPALQTAQQDDTARCFFVGRRGTGKTTITRHLERTRQHVHIVRPDLFSPSLPAFSLEQFMIGNQRPFQSLVSAFSLSLLQLAINQEGLPPAQAGPVARELRDLHLGDDYDFDLGTIEAIRQIMTPLAQDDEKAWLRQKKRPKQVVEILKREKPFGDARVIVLFDAIDESWDGSELAVVYLAALMHACIELNGRLNNVRFLCFIRENIFERVRVIDSEFARLETCVVGLDWTVAQLREMVEKRLNINLTAKYQLNGQTWSMFFEGPDSESLVFDYCQKRPRDVITYLTQAIDTANGQKHKQVTNGDLLDARRRFSTSRLSDLGDEYQENYPNIQLVLNRFYGFGQRWTVPALGAYTKRLQQEAEIKRLCAEWIYRFGAPEQFARLLYDIGFMGFVFTDSDGKKRPPVYRSLGPRDTTPPPISAATDLAIHPSYWDALDLQDRIVTDVGPEQAFSRVGVREELPNSWSLEEYADQVEALEELFPGIPGGVEGAGEFEEFVGELVRLCFFRGLDNIQPQVRDLEGTQIRDWIASNRAESGFWSTVRARYDATQVIFECKNKETLKASDFHQLVYYLNSRKGRLGFLCFRGKFVPAYERHLKACLVDHGVAIIPLGENDLRVFMRQAKNGKVKESHLFGKLDTLERL